MKRYYAEWMHTKLAKGDPGPAEFQYKQDVYLASEVDARIAELEKALRPYAYPNNWKEFRVTEGDIFGSREGDVAFAFNADSDSPWSVAANVL